MKILKPLSLISLMILLITACSAEKKIQPTPTSSVPEETNTVIDWIDFVHVKDQEYTASYDLAISSEQYIETKPFGKVEFKIGGVVTEPNYKSKNGDASYLPIGTQLYAIKGLPTDEIMAVKTTGVTNGYRIYMTSDSESKYTPDFDTITNDNILTIEVIEGDQIISQLDGDRKEKFLNLLRSGLNMENFTPNASEGDTIGYRLVMYTAGALSYQFDIFDDQNQVYFYPKNARIIDSAVKEFLAAG